MEDVKPRQRVHCIVPLPEKVLDYKSAFGKLKLAVEYGEKKLCICYYCNDSWSRKNVEQNWEFCRKCRALLCGKCVSYSKKDEYDPRTTMVWFYCTKCASSIDMTANLGVEPGSQTVVYTGPYQFVV